MGRQVETEQGVTATVRGLNIIKGTVLLAIEGGDAYVEVQASEIKPLKKEDKALKKDKAKEKKKKPAKKSGRSRRKR